jgi:hypothetical protein
MEKINIDPGYEVLWHVDSCRYVLNIEDLFILATRDFQMRGLMKCCVIEWRLELFYDTQFNSLILALNTKNTNNLKSEVRFTADPTLPTLRIILARACNK